MSLVLAVVGAVGGVGASCFAAALARGASGGLLLDVDPVGGGIDVLLGIEQVPGVRWSGLRVGGGGLDPAGLLAGLPCWDEVPVLALDQDAPTVPGIAAVLDACAAAEVPVAVDVGRGDTAARAAVLARADLVVLLAAGRVRDIAAGRAVLRSLGVVATGVVIRRGDLHPRDAAEAIGVPLLGALPARSVRSADCIPAAVQRTADAVVSGARDAGRLR